MGLGGGGMAGRQTRNVAMAGAGLLLAALAAGNANAQSNLGSSLVNGLFGAVQNAAARSAAARNAWQQVDLQTQGCLASQYNLDVNRLAAQGVMPGDARVAPDIQACQAAAQQSAPQQQATQQASTEPQQAPASAPKPGRADLVQRYGGKDADLILAGQIAKGMNEDEVVLAWG
jgi:hypothetical protein